MEGLGWNLFESQGWFLVLKIGTGLRGRWILKVVITPIYRGYNPSDSSYNAIKERGFLTPFYNDRPCRVW